MPQQPALTLFSVRRRSFSPIGGEALAVGFHREEFDDEYVGQLVFLVGLQALVRLRSGHSPVQR
jgi:hypothetical protein